MQSHCVAIPLHCTRIALRCSAIKLHCNRQRGTCEEKEEERKTAMCPSSSLLLRSPIQAQGAEGGGCDATQTKRKYKCEFKCTCNAVQCSAKQSNAMHHGQGTGGLRGAQCDAIQFKANATQCNTMQRNTMRCDCNAMQCNADGNTIKRNATQRNAILTQ